MNVRGTLLAIFCLFQGLCAFGAHTRARLILDAITARPGDIVMAGVDLRMEPGWHTYWRNPGQEGGLPTTIKWELPPGVTAGDIKWPLPEKVKIRSEAVGNQPATETINFVYTDDVVLLVPLKLSKDLKPGDLKLKADVSWLECATKCIPSDASVEADFQIGPNKQPSADQALISQWQSKVPGNGVALDPRASWSGPATATPRPLVIAWNTRIDTKITDFYPYANDAFEVDPNTKLLSSDKNQLRVEALVKKSGADWPKQISGVLVENTSGARRGYEVTLNINQASPASAQTNSRAESALWLMLLYAFVGGMILNVMPCVLPVIALKILGFVNESRNEPGRVRRLGFMYAIGVVVSFEVLAAIIIGLNSAGKQAGWGLQFGNPQFLVILTVLVTLVALNLFGVFEVTAGGLMNAAGAATSRHGMSGAFLNGVLATVLATPCTAPFMSVALGFAFAQPASLIALVFFTIGAGLAFPYVLLSCNPQWLKFLPKPGAWMENFKIIMGFPMLATAVWLFSLTTVHYGDRSWWLGIFLVIVGLAAWIYGRFVQHGQSRRGLAVASIAGLLLIGYAEVIEGQLHWRMRETARTDSLAVAREPGGIPWQAWSAEALAAARNEGRPVVVDFTANWCVTCQTIVKPAFESPTVREKIQKLHALPLLADYSKLPDDLTLELKRFGRAGVPMVLIYPTNAAKPPMVLPDPDPIPFKAVSNYRQNILAALDKVAD